ncbi:hypothetical protein [Eisenibacter elegans]|nr:hypothetical protein [Eisenibacter elegans]
MPRQHLWRGNGSFWPDKRSRQRIYNKSRRIASGKAYISEKLFNFTTL